MNDDQYVDIYSHIYWGYLRRLSCIIILSCSVFRYFFLFSSLRPQFLSLHDYFIFLIATRVLPRSSSFRTAAIPGFFFFFPCYTCVSPFSFGILLTQRKEAKRWGKKLLPKLFSSCQQPNIPCNNERKKNYE